MLILKTFSPEYQIRKPVPSESSSKYFCYFIVMSASVCCPNLLLTRLLCCSEMEPGNTERPRMKTLSDRLSSRKVSKFFCPDKLFASSFLFLQ